LVARTHIGVPEPMFATSVDSRQYRFAYEIATLSDAPDDFDLSGASEHTLGGLFLPRDDPAWFGRSVPPRVLLISPSDLTMFSHPYAGISPIMLPLASIDIVESGHALLIGWIHIHYADATIMLPYNTRSARPVDRFIRRLRTLVFSPACTPHNHERTFGAELDIKFRNARREEIDDGECIYASFFQPPTELPRRFGWLSLRRWSPGDFIALGDRRVLWISDRIDGRYDRYGVVARYGRIASRSTLEFHPDRRDLVLSLGANQTWRIPIRAEWVGTALSFTERTRPELLPAGRL